jgi:hypothetical protein
MSESTTIKRYCPECRKSISHFADKCPYCTADVSSTSDNKVVVGGIAAVFVFWREILIGAIVAILAYFFATFFTKRYALAIGSIGFLIVWLTLGVKRYRIWNRKIDEMFKK